jgi:hypothetical protein
MMVTKTINTTLLLLLCEYACSHYQATVASTAAAAGVIPVQA